MGYREWRSRLRDYEEITHTAPMVRRYFVIGAFDGVLTILALILGAAAAGAATHTDPTQLTHLILLSSGAAALGLSISSGLGAYEVERVERKLDQYTLEGAMLSQMGATHKGAFTYAAALSALVHALAPLIAAAFPVLPFLFLPFAAAIPVSVVIALAFLAVIGAYLGSLLRERLPMTALRFVLAGLVVAVVLYFLGGK